PQDPDEECESQRGGGAAQPERNGVGGAAAQINGGGHQTPSRRDNRRSIRRAISSTTKVTTNSRKPSAISAERCVPTASLNSLAMLDEIDVPGISSEPVMS